MEAQKSGALNFAEITGGREKSFEIRADKPIFMMPGTSALNGRPHFFTFVRGNLQSNSYISPIPEGWLPPATLLYFSPQFSDPGASRAFISPRSRSWRSRKGKIS